MAIGFGVDTDCADTYRAGRLVSGARALAQACYRRVTTPRGTLRGGDEEAIYGIDILDYVGATHDRTLAQALPGVVRGELLKDDRVAFVDVNVVITGEGLSVEIYVTSADELESYEFTRAVGDVSLTIAVNA